MSPASAAALSSLAPPAALWLSWPRRRWAAWAVAAAEAAYWVCGFAWVTGPAERFLWLCTGGWGMFGCLYAAYVVGRDSAEYRRLETSLEDLLRRKAELATKAAESRAKGGRAEAEQREVLALFAMVKGLSEALSWDEVRPKLEAAVQQYLGVEEFALYVAEMRAAGAMHPLVTRRLGNSVGANWDTLERWFQERGLEPSSPRFIEAPERAVAVPIRESQEMMGFFYARIPSGADPKAMLAKASKFAEEAAFAFRRLKLFQEVERLSQIDGLTGVYRRGVLDQRLADEVVRSKTFKTTFCLMLLDIDHFKKLNDTYGHPFGDQVLRRIGAILKESVYETDFVARYGGEEFAILLPRAEAAGVLRKAEAVRTAVEREAFPLALETIRVTVSIGIAHFPRDGSTPEAVVHEADQALYHAKELGRNRAVDVAEVRKR